MSVRQHTFWAAFAAAALAVGATLAFDLLGLADGGWRPWARLALGTAAAAAGATAAARWVGLRVAARLAHLNEAAEALAGQPSATGLRVPEADPEIARLYEAFNAMSRSMYGLVERERSFARYASHELRTPVGAMKVQLERVDLGSASAAEVLPAVARQTARIEELLDALLTLARAREQTSRMQTLRALLREAVDSLPEHVRPRIYVVEPVPEVRVRDAVLVRQALRNLLDNAVSHGAGPVTVRTEGDGATLVARVRDMGSGIAVTELRRLADGSERHRTRPDGHGLGLTLVALIARALDGRLHLHNAEPGLEASLSLRVIDEGQG